jgi:hypothetical protein
MHLYIRYIFIEFFLLLLIVKMRSKIFFYSIFLLSLIILLQFVNLHYLNNGTTNNGSTSKVISTGYNIKITEGTSGAEQVSYFWIIPTSLIVATIVLVILIVFVLEHRKNAHVAQVLELSDQLS